MLSKLIEKHVGQPCPNHGCASTFYYSAGYLRCDGCGYRGSLLTDDYLTFLYALEPANEGEYTTRIDKKVWHRKAALVHCEWQEHFAEIKTYPKLAVDWNISRGIVYRQVAMSPEVCLIDLPEKIFSGQSQFWGASVAINQDVQLFVQEYFAGIATPDDDKD